ncbi:MAG: flagellar hook-associated protein FlgK, partial [Planctomycetaceae bacterium]|nr:flagellar hook-associated protein FlgK [Planctomycetaceae bacterium]
MSYLDIGLSGIRANQVALRMIGHNIANAGTEGYHRQDVRLADRLPVTLQGLSLGTGVDVARIERLVQQTVESALTSNTSVASRVDAQRSAWRSIETILLPGEGSLEATAADLFDAIAQLASQPGERSLSDQVVQSASRLTAEFNRSWQALDDFASGLIAEVETAVSEVNRLAGELAPLRDEIRQELALGRQPNDLLDRRDALVSQLARLVDVDRQTGNAAGTVLTAAGGTFIIAPGAEPLTAVCVEGEISLRLSDSDQSVNPRAGKLAGILASVADIRQLQTDLADWFDALRQPFDQIQATGLSGSGPLTSTRSVHSVASDALPIAGGLVAGEFYVTVTNLATQQRTTQAIAIDPNVDKLGDIVSRLDAVPGLNAVWDAATGHLSLFAADGVKFDFAGRLDQEPLTAGSAGTATATIGGQYTGGVNTLWRVTAIDAGETGVSSPLKLEVREAASGTLLRTVDAGVGYEAGTGIDLGDGVLLQLTPGTLLAGDEWTIRPVAEPDPTGFLASLGISSFFVGDAPGAYAVRD